MKQRRLRNWRNLSLALIASLGVAVAASPDVGYLRRVGPAPLRFSPVLQPVSFRRFVLPAPEPAPEPAPIVSQIEKAQQAASAPKPAVVTQAASPPQPQMEALPPDAVVSPQMLLKYFNPSTNGTGPVTAPLEFTPPRTAGPSPSPTPYTPRP